MQKQKQMQESFLAAHREFMASLKKSLEVLEEDIADAAEVEQKCTDEWCEATEHVIDELAKVVYSISEPRWVSADDSHKLAELRRRVHDLYAKYKGTRP